MKLATKCKRADTIFPKHLKKLRTRQKLSKLRLAEQAGLSDSYIVMLEQGERKPSLETLVRLAHALEISLIELIEPVNKAISK